LADLYQYFGRDGNIFSKKKKEKLMLHIEYNIGVLDEFIPDVLYLSCCRCHPLQRHFTAIYKSNLQTSLHWMYTWESRHSILFYLSSFYFDGRHLYFVDYTLLYSVDSQ